MFSSHSIAPSQSIAVSCKFAMAECAAETSSCGLFGTPGESSHFTNSIFGIYFSNVVQTLILCSFVSVILYTIYRSILWLWPYFLEQYTVVVHISGNKLNYQAFEIDNLYHWVLKWFSENLKDLPNVTVHSDTKCDENGKRYTEFQSAPGFGWHIFRYEGHWIVIHRVERPDINCQKISYESITLRTWKSGRDALYNILKESEPKVEVTLEKTTRTYRIDLCNWVECGYAKKVRPISSVIFQNGIHDRVMTDVQRFLSRETWYVDRGIPYRRGYLLYGPPGCGKTSYIRAVAGAIEYDICILSISAKGLDDDRLNDLMNSTPEKCIVLIEDVDAAFKSRKDEGATTRETNLAYEGCSPSTVTFRGLLNALDGVASTEGRIVFMTTNCPDKLDPALTRPGRVDLKVLIDYPDDDQLGRMFLRFYPDANEDTVTRFVKAIRDLKRDVSLAMTQGLFIMYQDDAEECLQHLPEYFKEQFCIDTETTDKGSNTSLYS